MATDAPTKVIRRHGELSHDDELAACLVDEMVGRWRAGERVPAEELLARHTHLQNEPDAAIRVIYEEFCLRRELGEMVPPEEIYCRFPRWREQLQVLLDCHRLLDEPPAPSLPAVSESLGEFILLAELGRGVQGRVYLASQPALADRLVVLKTTPRTGREHLTLARLQHTHIMPLYAVRDEPKRNLRTLCMPYFGGAALRQVLDELQDMPVSQRTGRHLLDALDRAEARSTPESLGGTDGSTAAREREPIRQLFARATYVEAVCWIGACLADALQYAHERGLVHLDLKPSNVLLAGDGQPMLLDFHIAQGPIQAGRPLPEGIGGTPAYLSPEQSAAMVAAQKGEPIRAAVDGRSDIYSLGLLLHEALGGKLLLDDHVSIPRLSDLNNQVSVGLADIIAKCIQADPSDRYPSAAALATDLRRHLGDLPLQYVRNRSLTERWRKWRQRRPYALALGLMGIAVLSAALSIGLVNYRNTRQHFHEAESALVDGQQLLKNRSYAQAVDTLTRGKALAENVSMGSSLANKLDQQLHVARRALAAEQLHALVDRLRFLYGASSIPAGEARPLANRWRAVWDKRTWLKDQSGGELESAIEQRLDTDLLDLGIIGADLRVRLAEPADVAPARREALQVLADTETLFGASHILCRQREIFAQALGQSELANSAARCAAKLTPQSAWEYYALGRSLLQAGELEKAGPAFGKAVELQPQGFWPNFYQGVCSYRQKQFENAVSAFRVCIALAPDSADCYYNRALALTELKRVEQALQDYDRALQLDSHLAAAALNRGLLYLGQKRYGEAQADLHHALADGADPAVVHYNLALIHLEQHDGAAALASVQRALQANASHAGARALLHRLQPP